MSKASKKQTYLDYASTTPADKLALKAMLPYLERDFGNSATLYRRGRDAREALEKSREMLAAIIGAKAHEIFYTSSATESNNLALKGVAFANRAHGKHVVTSLIEHDSILEPARWLERQGFEVSYLPVDKNCRVSPQDVEKALRPDTILVSIMHANNETGAIQPIREISAVIAQNVRHYTLNAHRYALPILHTDASQTVGKIPVNVHSLGVDMLTASSHKIYGPKGAALLYVGSGVNIEPILHGGGHERGLRSSTVNVPAIIGFAKAASEAAKMQKDEHERQDELRSMLINSIMSEIPGASLNCDSKRCLPGIISARFERVSGEELLFALDIAGFEVSIASGCSSTSLEPSHVLLACGLSRQAAMSSIRVSLGRATGKQDIEKFATALARCVKRIRELN
jgi:cysteine desulfurase